MKIVKIGKKLGELCCNSPKFFYHQCFLLYGRCNQTDLFSYANTLIEPSNNKTFTLMLLILEHDTSIMGSTKSILGKNFWEIPKSIMDKFLSIFDCGLYAYDFYFINITVIHGTLFPITQQHC